MPQVFQILGIKRILIIAILIGINAAVGAATYLYFMPHNDDLSNQLGTLTSQVSAKRGDTSRLQNEFQTIQEQKVYFGNDPSDEEAFFAVRREHGVTVVSLYPGLVRTEAVMAAAQGGWLDLRNSESPEFIGRVVAALHADPHLMDRSGSVLVAAQVARELDVTDTDGTHPAPLTIEHV